MRDVRFATAFTFLFFAMSFGCKEDQALPPENTLNQPVIFLSDTVFVDNFYVRWSKSMGAASYELQESDNPGFTNYSQVYLGQDTATYVTERPFGSVLYYRVRAMNQYTVSVWSTPRSVTLFSPPWVVHTGWTSQELTAVQCLDQQTAIVIGSAGTVLRTANEGQTWTTIPMSTANNLNSIKFFDSNLGFLAGNGGIVFKTTNGGITWAQPTSPLSGDLYSVEVSGQNIICIAAKGVLDSIFCWVSVNGGTSWNRHHITISAAWPYGLAFGDSATGVCVGGGHPFGAGRVFRTTSGGTSWTSINSGASGILKSVDFMTANECVAVGFSYGTDYIPVILRSVNNGQSWEQVALTENVGFWGVSFPSSTVGFAVGTSGSIFQTLDAGISWHRQQSGTTQPLVAVDFFDSLHGVAVGGGTILTTRTGGN